MGGEKKILIADYGTSAGQWKSAKWANISPQEEGNGQLG